MHKSKIIGMGFEVPDNIISNDDLSKGPNFHYYTCVQSDRYVYLFYEKYMLYMVEIGAF